MSGDGSGHERVKGNSGCCGPQGRCDSVKHANHAVALQIARQNSKAPTFGESELVNGLRPIEDGTIDVRLSSGQTANGGWGDEGSHRPAAGESRYDTREVARFAVMDSGNAASRFGDRGDEAQSVRPLDEMTRLRGQAVERVRQVDPPHDGLTDVFGIPLEQHDCSYPQLAGDGTQPDR